MRRKERRAFGLINQARGRDQYLQELGRIRLMKVLKTALWMALIVNPLSSHALGNLSSTHSPVEERIRRLEGMAAGIRR